jgi:hypothetical protein
MPIDPQTGEWVPEQEIARRRALANQMWDVPTAPGWAGGLAKLLGGGVHGYQNAKMSQAIGGNQAMQQRALQGAADVQNPRDLAKMLMGVPGLAPQGLSILAESLKSDPPKFGPIGQDEYGQPIHGWIDSKKQTVTPAAPQAPAPQPGAAPGQPPAEPQSAGPPINTLTGDELLERLKGQFGEPIPNIVKSIAEGRMAPLPQGRGNARNQKIMAWVSQYDPTFDLTQWKARNTTHTNFSSGVESRNAVALNTSLKHLMDLSEAIDKLDNWNTTGGTAVRTFTNPIARKIDPAAETKISNFETIRRAVAEEVAKAFHGQPTVTGTEGWLEEINSAGSPQALHGTVAKVVKLLEGRSDALTDQYTRAMGKSPERPFITDETRKGYDTLKKRAALWDKLGRAPTAEEMGQPAQKDGSPAPRAAAPPPPEFIAAATSVGIPPDLAAKIPEGGSIKNPKTGQKFYRINGRLMDEKDMAAGDQTAAPPSPPALPNPHSNFDASGRFRGAQ